MFLKRFEDHFYAFSGCLGGHRYIVFWMFAVIYILFWMLGDIYMFCLGCSGDVLGMSWGCVGGCLRDVLDLLYNTYYSSQTHDSISIAIIIGVFIF